MKTHLLSFHTRRITALAILLCGFAALIAGCNRGTSGGGDTITIGVVLPITGREGKPGQYPPLPGDSQ